MTFNGSTRSARIAGSTAPANAIRAQAKAAAEKVAVSCGLTPASSACMVRLAA